MDTKRAFWSTPRLVHLSASLILLVTSGPPALAQSAAPPAPAAAADTTRAAPAPPPATPPATRVLTCADGERDADSRHEPLTYGILGAATGPIGVGMALWRRPGPGAAALAGVPADATVEYSRCYSSRARRKNVKAAANGFAISAIVGVIAIAYADSKTAP